jgi:hypothetical protein
VGTDHLGGGTLVSHRPAVWAAVVVLAAAASAAAGGAVQPRPLFEIGRDRTLLVSALPEVLSLPEVRPHLTTGLTTSFIVTTAASATGGRRVRGAARVDVRWEPWDEVFHVAWVGADGKRRREVVPSYERLGAWWRGLELPVATALPAGSWAVKVELSVIPFSQSEQRDAQRWFSNAPGPEGPEPAVVAEGESRLNGVVDLLIATSIQRRSIFRYAWAAAPRPVEHRR